MKKETSLREIEEPSIRPLQCRTVWIESCTELVEDHSGVLSVLCWFERAENMRKVKMEKAA